MKGEAVLIALLIAALLCAFWCGVYAGQARERAWTLARIEQALQCAEEAQDIAADALDAQAALTARLEALEVRR